MVPRGVTARPPKRGARRAANVPARRSGCRRDEWSKASESVGSPPRYLTSAACPLRRELAGDVHPRQGCEFRRCLRWDMSRPARRVLRRPAVTSVRGVVRYEVIKGAAQHSKQRDDRAQRRSNSSRFHVSIVAWDRPTAAARSVRERPASVRSVRRRAPENPESSVSSGRATEHTTSHPDLPAQISRVHLPLVRVEDPEKVPAVSTTRAPRRTRAEDRGSCPRQQRPRSPSRPRPFGVGVHGETRCATCPLSSS